MGANHQLPQHLARSLSDFHTNRRIRSPIDQFRLSYAKCSDLDATEKPKLRVAEQIKRKSDRLLAGYSFKLLPLDLHEMNDALVRGDIDFILTNPGNYVELEARHGITRIATLRNVRQGRAYVEFGAVIFARAERTDIRKLSDLKHASFAAVDTNAFGGFEMAWRELAEAGLDPFREFRELKFVGFPQDEVVYQVRDGKADAGTVRTDVLERMANRV